MSNPDNTSAMDQHPEDVGRESPKCGGKLRQSDGLCRRPAGAGTPHKGIGRCKLHGGSTPSHVAAGQKEMARRAAATYGAPRDINPVQALVEIMQNAAGHMTWLLEIIQLENPEALVWGVADETEKGSGEFPGVDIRKAAGSSAWLQRYDIERKVLRETARDLAGLGIQWDAREAVRKQGAALAQVTREMARRLGHDPADERVTAAYRAALKSVVGLGADVGRVVDVDPE